MLKACWECVAGSGVIRNDGGNDGSYGIQLNGDSQRAPLRPAVHAGGANMFVVPRPLNVGDKVLVSGNFNNTDGFTINLLTGERPDYDNIACQVEINFPSSTNNSNGIVLRIIESGESEVINGSYLNNLATDMMSGSIFKFEFKFESSNGSQALTVNVKESNLEQFEMKHDVPTITFLEITGDVKVTSLCFEFS